MINGLCSGLVEFDTSPLTLLTEESDMGTELKKTQIEVHAEFELRRRRMKRCGYIVSPLAFAIIMLLLFSNEGTLWIYLWVGFIAMVVLLRLSGMVDWSCPACREPFRKAGLGIRFCPYCGVSLVDEATQLALEEGSGIQSQDEDSGAGG
ncbi:MAG TPA: hypothetical protein PLA50_05830 [Bacteroidia bacterium]|nr:hypothetical protein [Bacteroidia bacterium]